MANMTQIIQGHNTPLTIILAEDVTEATDIRVQLTSAAGKELKTWTLDGTGTNAVTVNKQVLICPLMQAETMEFPRGRGYVEFHWVYEDGLKHPLDDRPYPVQICAEKDLTVMGADPVITSSPVEIDQADIPDPTAVTQAMVKTAVVIMVGADITAAAVTEALGYTPADADELTAVKENLQSCEDEIGTEETARKSADSALQTAIDGKQDALTAGDNITIENGVISAVGGSGLSDDIKAAMIGVLQYEVAYVGTDRTYTDTLIELLQGGTPVTRTLVSIALTLSATSADIGTTTSSLIKSVVGTYSLSTGGTVEADITGYTVSPETIVNETQDVTVSYGGITSNAVTVTGSGSGESYVAYWDLTSSLVDTVSGKTISLFNSATQDSDGLHLSGSDAYALIDDGLMSFANKRVVFEFGTVEKAYASGHGRLIRLGTSESAASFDHALCYRSTGVWQLYTGNWKDIENQITDENAMSGGTVEISEVTVGNTYNFTVKINGVEVFNGDNPYVCFAIGASSQSYYNATIKKIKVYDYAE